MVKFKMDSEFVEEVENYVSYKLQSCKEYSIIDLELTPCLVIADLGGLLGLFLGCSLISIVEMFYYLTGGLLNILMKCRIPKGNNETPQGVIMVTPYNRNDLQVSNNDILHALTRIETDIRQINNRISIIDQKVLALQMERSNRHDTDFN